MNQELRALIVEDSEDDALLLIHELKLGGYRPIHERVETAEDLQRVLGERQWDIILSDYRMPSFNALGALAIVKASGLDLPFIIISGKIGEETAVAAMKAGANDYVMKGNLSRLVPAIEREMREAAERRGRRRAEEMMHTQFNQISTIFDSLYAVVSVVDMETCEILYLNKYAAGIFDSDWRGRPCYEVLHADRDEPCQFCTNDKLIKDGVPQPPVVWESRNSVTGRWYQCIDRAVRWTDGRMVRMEVAIDITDRKELEQMKDEMISAVSHEMHTPLTAMMGFTEFLLENEVDREQLKSYLTTIYRETDRLNDLINNFLHLQRLKVLGSHKGFGPVSVDMLLQDCATLYFAASRKHQIVTDCQPGIPLVLGNEEQLHQVMNNLLSNAVKYSPAGGEIRIEAGTEEDRVIIRVVDKGLGIPPEALHKVFDKFYRVDNSDRRLVGGTGLGLALVREIVRAHGGNVWVESILGKGSTFSLSLPVMKS